VQAEGAKGYSLFFDEVKRLVDGCMGALTDAADRLEVVFLVES
jgi:hypothetical protein